MSGDTLWDIAARNLGDPERWPEIFDANQAVIEAEARKHPGRPVLGTSDHGHWIFPGTVLTIPGATCTHPTSPSHPINPSQAASSVPTDCNHPLLIGLRGSGQNDILPQGSELQKVLGPEVSGIAEGLGADVLDYGVPASAYPAVKAEDLMTDVAGQLGAKLKTAENTPPISLLPAPQRLGAAVTAVGVQIAVTGLKTPDSVAKGAARLQQDLRDRVHACPTQKIVLAGYSQGAWAIRVALDKLKDDPNWPQIRDSISGIGFVGEPNEIWAHPRLSQELRDRTYSACAPGDPVCGNVLGTVFDHRCFNPFNPPAGFNILCPHLRYGTEAGVGPDLTYIQDVANSLRLRLNGLPSGPLVLPPGMSLG
ncbi:cutinase family protein [Streptomyces rishiriensis]|uniref:cutinase family protein n=1 Tax=Streptomyces rishiriensis TaxID=68264 RepID=UPI003F4D5BC5